MIDHKQELWDDLDELRDYALTLKRTSQDILDWIHVLETDMQLFIEDQTKPAFVKLDTPVEPGSPCIDPEGAGCKCYEGCSADCLPSEYKACQCPRKIRPHVSEDTARLVEYLDSEPEDEPVFTLTEKGELIMNLINQGWNYLDACRAAEAVFVKKE